ncbi:MAG: site-specific integrase, partial [Acidobacteria bacterium]|nr:site-specific integrase [Acidobacteriota bacterium]
KSKRVSFYGKTRAEAQVKLLDAKAQVQRGLARPDRAWKLGNYLDYWLESVVRPTRRPKTYEQYECAIRLYLKPGLGTWPLSRLSVPIVQSFFNQTITDGHSVRKTQIIRTVLSSALSRAVREELVGRNVARLVELPTWQRGEIHPWSVEEARQFLNTAQTHPLYPAFLLLLLCGLRRGETLGLRWRDIDFDASEIHIRQQLQRVGRMLLAGEVKTTAGRRDLPLLEVVRTALQAHHERQHAARAAAGANWADVGSAVELVFTTATGRPIEPRNFVRSFWSICERGGIRVIKLHHVRHTTATLLKNLGVPARDAQLILGHSQVSVTQEIYQHDDMADRRSTLGKIEALLLQTAVYGRDRARCRQTQPSNWNFVATITSIISGGSSGFRTHDTLLKSSINDSLEARLASVKQVAQRRTRTWLLGCVAVNLAVKCINVEDTGSCAACGRRTA